MDEDPVGRLLDEAAERLAAYGYVLAGSRAEGDELVRAAIARVFARHRRPADARVAEGRVRAAMRAMHLARVRREASWRAHLPWRASRSDAGEGAAAEAGDPLGRALAALSPHERAAVVLRHYDHLAVPEIATAMRLSDGAAAELLASARGALAATLGPLDAEPDEIPVVAPRRP